MSWFNHYKICERVASNVHEREEKIKAEYEVLENLLNVHIDKCGSWPIVFNQSAEYEESYMRLRDRLKGIGFAVIYIRAKSNHGIIKTLRIWPNENVKAKDDKKNREIDAGL